MASTQIPLTLPLLEFQGDYNEKWLIERHGHRRLPSDETNNPCNSLQIL